jgi:choline kinase
VAWGIVQAKIPGLEAALASSSQPHHIDEADSNSDDNDGEQTPTAPQPADPTLSASDTAAEQVKQEVAAAEAADEFDYLAYAQDRAFFFWADMLSLGLVREEDFPAGVLEHVKKRIIGR